jgi:hypothetical protein
MPLAEKDPPTKELCEWSKSQLETHFALLAKIVTEPTYACTKCGRAANQKKWLCKPRRLPKEE